MLYTNLILRRIAILFERVEYEFSRKVGDLIEINLSRVNFSDKDKTNKNL